MKDLNFFELYIEKKEFKIDREIIIFFVAIIFVLSDRRASCRERV